MGRKVLIDAMDRFASSLGEARKDFHVERTLMRRSLEGILQPRELRISFNDRCALVKIQYRQVVSPLSLSR